MSQSEFAKAAGGLSKGAQINYEADRRTPDARYLATAAKLGVDVNFVVSGFVVVDFDVGMTALSVTERMLVRHYRATDKNGQTAIETVAEAISFHSRRRLKDD